MNAALKTGFAALTTKLVAGTCHQHGAFERGVAALIADRPGYVSACPTCEAEARARAEEEHRKQEVAQHRRWMQDDAGLRGRFRDATFDTFQAKTDEQRQTLDACHAYAEGFAPHHGGGLWLLGNVGTGKTHLASAIVNYLIERGVRSSIVTARGIVQKLRAGWGTRESSEHERRVIEDLSTVPLLVVDEAGYGVTSHLERVQLFDVLDLRYQDRRPTVLVSNLGVRDMRTRLDERLYDRLHDGATVLVFDWESWRAWGNNS